MREKPKHFASGSYELIRIDGSKAEISLTAREACFIHNNMLPLGIKGWTCQNEVETGKTYKGDIVEA